MTDNKDSQSDTESQGEGYWASLMADEADAANMDHGDVYRNNAELLNVNWEYILTLLDNETLVECTVVEYNTGGLIVDGDGLRGFVPISHLAESRSFSSDNEKLKYAKSFEGKTLKVKVIECDPERGRVVLSERAAQTAPGARRDLFRSLNKGDKLSGTVTNITDFGVFVDLGGLEGLVHLSEISWGRVHHPSEALSLGDNVEVIVLGIDQGEGRISLSIKQLLENPWDRAAELFPIGEIFQAKVTQVVDFGAFARFDNGIEGLIHISQMALEPGLTPSDVLKSGQWVDVEIARVDTEKHRMSLRLIND